ncbi:ribosomal RNA processing 1B [Rattus norvegicus]|uniref:Ribosomal RNA processing 1B n=1 Tax=Rattus norvegicus TaxID=10116 RepID=D3ZY39_RAT|nr:ribosomal RNA processing 1B [Rattus norvegicus]|eukprot:XP_228076.4 PREDICTED: ribosomal RNA processing protein 1 homolog B isoform X1 [Rattus norvegicus]
MAPAMQSTELQFAQRLASSEKGVRDRAVRKLRQYLSARTQSDTGSFSQEELLKIWKGLFYCMWVQDEPLLQEELANIISQLIHVVNSSEAQHLFIQTFWQTVNREWQGIDKLRLDKYYMLIRLVLRQSFEVLKRNAWEESQITLFLDILMKEILSPESRSPNGVRSHLIDVYLDELSTVGGRELLADQNLKLIDPFCRIAAKTKDHTLVQTVAKGVFEVIVDQSAFVPEESVEEQKTKEDGNGLPANELACQKVVGGKKTALDECLRDGVIGSRERDICAALKDSGSPLQFDYKAVADRLLEIANSKSTPPFNRKRLCRLVRKFQDLSEGNGAQLSFAEDISAGENGQALSQRRHKRKRKKLLERAALEREEGNTVSAAGEEDGGGHIHKRKRKKRKRSHFQSDTQDLGSVAEAAVPSADSEPGAAQRHALQACVAAPTAEATSNTRENSSEPTPATPIHSKRKRQRKKNLRAHREIWKSTTLPQEDVSKNDPASGQPQTALISSSEGGQARKRKRKLGALPVSSGDLTVQKAGTPASPVEGNDGQTTLPRCKRSQKKTASNTLDHYDPSSQKTAISKKRKKMKQTSNGVLECSAGQIQALGSNRTLKKPLKMEDDLVKFDTRFLPKALFFRKAKNSSATRPQGPTVQLNKTPSSSKKVTFGLNRNMTAEFKKTDKSILVSPTGLSRVAFNPEQRPLHGVLKTPTSSPASTPLSTMKLPATTPKRRPRAADFF